MPKKARGRPKKRLSLKALAKDKQEIYARVKELYAIINKATGRIGGNGSGGPCYGELTIGNMQKTIDKLKKHTGLNHLSMVIDIGCGLAKPSLHFAQDPKVQFSFGIEVEDLRTNLGLVNLHHVLNAAKKNDKIGHTCILQCGDITKATSFDPFTHIYQFDVA